MRKSVPRASQGARGFSGATVYSLSGFVTWLYRRRVVIADTPTKGDPMKRSSVLPCLAVLSIALACAGAASAADTAPAATPTDAKKVDWANMSFEQRKKLMKSSVLPELKKAFH